VPHLPLNKTTIIKTKTEEEKHAYVQGVVVRNWRGKRYEGGYVRLYLRSSTFHSYEIEFSCN